MPSKTNGSTARAYQKRLSRRGQAQIDELKWVLGPSDETKS